MRQTTGWEEQEKEEVILHRFNHHHEIRDKEKKPKDSSQTQTRKEWITEWESRNKTSHKKTTSATPTLLLILSSSSFVVYKNKKHQLKCVNFATTKMIPNQVLSFSLYEIQNPTTQTCLIITVISSFFLWIPVLTVSLIVTHSVYLPRLLRPSSSSAEKGVALFPLLIQPVLLWIFNNTFLPSFVCSSDSGDGSLIRSPLWCVVLSRRFSLWEFVSHGTFFLFLSRRGKN